MSYFEVKRGKFTVLLKRLKTKIGERERLSLLRKGRLLAVASFVEDDESTIINEFNNLYET
jgi:hypothetical protein